jgi:hypothetical protein
VLVVQGIESAAAVPTPSGGMARMKLVLVVNLKIVHSFSEFISSIYPTCSQ